MLNWVQQFNIFCLLDNQEYALAPNEYEYLLGAGCSESVDTLDALDPFLQKGGWTFGHLSYEAGHSVHGIETTKKGGMDFPLLFFFRPQIVVFVRAGSLHIDGGDAEQIYASIMAAGSDLPTQKEPVQLAARLSREAYVQKIDALLGHIRRGDCYEINFCQEFFGAHVAFNPVTAFHALCARSPNPFSAFYRYNNQYLVCASPERFLTRRGATLLSQPMKGTAPRHVPGDDAAGVTALHESGKDRAENVMIVDLVRNDLSVVCKSGTVKAAHLYEVLTFPSVYQMISTITGELREEVTFSEILRATYPMGSMTGAPKRRVMQLIEEFEEGPRGIFSGSVGYIAPGGDFDFNVVIRSLMYNGDTGYLSYQVGSGITTYSDPEKEWEECLLKGAAIKKVLGGSDES